MIALELPDAGSRVARLLGPRWWSVIPTHVHYFTRESAATMLRRNGFEPLYVATDPKSFTVRYYLDKGGGYLPGVSQALIAGAEALGVAEQHVDPRLPRPHAADRPPPVAAALAARSGA